MGARVMLLLADTLDVERGRLGAIIDTQTAKQSAETEAEEEERGWWRLLKISIGGVAILKIGLAF